LIALFQADVTAAFLVFCRVAGCMLLLPGLSSMRVPAMVRILAALALALAVSGLVGAAQAPVPSASQLFIGIVRESLTGGFFGLVARVYLLAFEFIASAAATMIGFNGMIGVPLEGTDQQTAMTALISLAALIMLFQMDFHHVVIAALVNTYEVVPQSALPDARLLMVKLLDVLRESFSIALRLGSPFIGFAIIGNLATGLLNKLAVQLPVYFIATPFLLFGTLTILYLAIPQMLTLFAQGFVPVFRLGIS
jgi:flagellar biosynthetic protein FliR